MDYNSTFSTTGAESYHCKMKALLLIAFIIFGFKCCFAQTDSVSIINKPNAQYIYNSQTRSSNLSYNYSNKWDFDGDKKMDSLYFIGNGGAHAYFYLQIILSSDGLTRSLPTVQIDMPYPATAEALKKSSKNPGVQFVVSDFNKDGNEDIYLNFNNPFGVIPKSWKNKAVKTKHVLLSFIGNKINVKDYF